jgi:hypothetical protein
MTDKSKSLTANWSISEQEIKDIGKALYEAPLTEEDRIIDRLKYTKKELSGMYAISLDDELIDIMYESIVEEIDKELLEKISKIEKHGKTRT